MKRIVFVAVSAALATAGLLAASVLAGSPPPPPPAPTSTGPTDTSTAPAPTDTTPGQTSPETTAPRKTTPQKTTPRKTAPQKTVPPPPPARRQKISKLPSKLPAGITVSGVHVGGLTYRTAYSALRLAFRSPVVLTLGDRKLSVSPSRLGAKAYIESALHRALHSRPGSGVRMAVNVHRDAVSAFVASLASRYDREVADARVVLERLRPRIVPEREGRKILSAKAVTAIVRVLQSNRRGPVAVPAKIDEPRTTADSFGPVIVVRRDSKWLYLYRQVRVEKPVTFVRRFQVATGQAIYPTPLGAFEIVMMERNPWWFPPDSAWAKDEKPIPPGPGNPLGTRWMGLSAPGVGIHGTPDPASLGYSASHGCIRMFIPSAEWLYSHVEVGTPVFIVSA